MGDRQEGKLIVFEGGEFSGKSTQIELLAKRLRKKGIKVIVTKEPGGTKFGQSIRQKLLTEKMTPEEELGWFLKDRKVHFRAKVLPALRNGFWVLCDRSSPSTIAYQHFGRGLDLEDIKRRDRVARQGKDFDLVILLDILPTKAFERAQAETRFEREDRAFHLRVRAGYLIQTKKNAENWLVLDASQPVEEISEKIWREVQERFLRNYQGAGLARWRKAGAGVRWKEIHKRRRKKRSRKDRGVYPLRRSRMIKDRQKNNQD